jgi:hypothetical protein
MGAVATKHNDYFCKKSKIEALDTGDFTRGVNCTFLMSSALVWYKVVSLECAYGYRWWWSRQPSGMA